MALLANQIMDARILSSMNGRVELPQFMRAPNQGIVSQVNSAQEDNRKNRKYPCPLCGKRFRFNSILSLHMRTHTGEKPFKCPYCDHRAAQKGNLKIHLRTHKQGILGKGRGRIREENRLLHELEERAILRDRQMRGGYIGHQQASHITQLQKHQLPANAATQPQLSLTSSGPVESLSHTSTSPQVTASHDEPVQPQPTGFRCSFCKGKFRKQQELDRHIRILHKPYKCTLCDFAASHEEELIGHVETAHITADSTTGQRPAVGGGDKGKPVGEFPCEVCGQTFSQAWFLKGHMRKHKDSFEHCCQICGRRFKEPWFLKNHMKVHLNKLAAKSKLPAEHEAPGYMSNVTQDPQTNLYTQYMSSVHNRFLTADRAGQPDYSQILATAGIEMKVREMLGRMMTSGSGPLTEGEGPSLLGLNHVHPPLSSNSMEYLQKAITDRDTLSSSGYPGWQIMAPGQQMFTPKDQQHQQQHPCSYLAERCLPVDERKACPGDPDAKVVSRPSTPGSLSHHGPTETITETGSSHSGSAQDNDPQSSSPPAGDKAYRCPLPGDYTGTQSASLGFHLERYHFPQWQNSRGPKSPLQPASTSPSPNPKIRPRSRENWSPAASHYLSLESHDEDALLINKRSDRSEKDPGADDFLQGRTGKSQHEPLDLSVRLESVASPADRSPGALPQASSVYSNGHASSATSGLQGYSEAVAELNVKPAHPSDVPGQGEKEEIHAQSATYGALLNNDSAGHNGEGAFEKPPSDQERGEEDEAAENDDVEPEERGQANATFQGPSKVLRLPHGEPGQWSRDVTKSPISSLEKFTPGHGHPLQHHRSLLSVLRSPGGLNNMAANGYKGSSNGGGTMEKEVASARKPFQCRFCPYSASQKGNLKTHVLCVHRKPFDNTLYPDRRLRRSHQPQRPSALPPSIMGDPRTPGRDQMTMTSLCGT